MSGSEAIPARPMDSTVAALQEEIQQHEFKGYVRSAQGTKLLLAHEYISSGAWGEALRILRPLWQSMAWRREGWWDLTEEVAILLRKVGAQVGDGTSVIAVDWELMSSTFPQKEGHAHDITKSIQHMDNKRGKPAVVLREHDIHSFLRASFAFDQAESKVGEPCRAQLSVTSYASKASAPVIMNEVTIQFEGALKPVTIRHSSDSPDAELCPDGTVFSTVPLQEEQSTSGRNSLPASTPVGQGSLTFSPGQTRVFQFNCPLREPGRVKALSATFAMSIPSFDLDYIIDFDRTTTPDIWWIQRLARKRVTRADPHSIVVQPKPPKMDIRFLSLKGQYYTNEAINLELEIFNGEEEDSIANLEVQISSELSGNPPLPLKIHVPDAPQPEEDSEDIPSHKQLGKIHGSSSIPATLELEPVQFQAVYEVALHLKYNLASDPDTPVSRTSVIRLDIASPFEANYDFSPRLDTRPWPSFFDTSDGGDPASEGNALGLPQKWCLTARYCSFAQEILTVEDTSLSVLSLNGGVNCTVNRASADTELGLPIEPGALAELHFDVLTQKLLLDDRRSASLDFALQIKWRRAAPDSPSNTTTLPIPRLLIASSEPRVLASVAYSPANSIPYILRLTYMIENPSMHFLTFSVVMEPSSKFAFSGAKASTLQLLPLSRRKVEFLLLPGVRGEWINPRLAVTDRYFQKVLRVQPGTEMKAEEEGIAVWVPPEDDDDE